MMMARALVMMTLACAGDAAATDKSWTVKPDFENEDAAVQISGVSCPGLSKRQKWCVAINDEKKYVQFFERDGRRIKPGKRVRILEKKDANGRKQGEPDIEAVARDGRFVYLTGSHGAARKGGDRQPSRFHVFRLPVDARTGAPEFKVTRKKVAKGIASSNRLGPAIAALPELARFAGQPLDQNGVTIEALGARDGQLFFGLRTPVTEDGAFILETSASALFSASDIALKPHRVALGDGYGLRAIERFRSGFLLLAGTGFGAEQPPVVWYWEPGEPLQGIAQLDVSNGWKAEALMLASDQKGKKPRIVVFFDGQRNGAPMEFKLPIAD